MTIDVGLDLHPDDKLELLVADLSLARALYEGVPAARMLARVRLAMDHRDMRTTSPELGGQSSFETLVSRLVNRSQPAADRVKRAVVRHARVAAGEGPLAAVESTCAALVYAVAIAEDVDASLAEVFSDSSEARINIEASREIGAFARSVAEACAAYDARLATRDPRAAMFEACIRMSSSALLGPLAQPRMLEAAGVLYRSELATPLLRLSPQPLFPRPIEVEVPRSARRMARLERADLDALLARDQREVAALVAGVERALLQKRPAGEPAVPLRLDSLIADLAGLLKHNGTLILGIAPAEIDRDVPSAPPPSQRPSWAPADWSVDDAAEELAEAIERGTATLPGVVSFVQRGGDPALDAIGREMLRAPAHPFASEAFAEILAASSRPRDVIRLVTYFAVAPDPAIAARTLSICEAPELPSVLKAWLEAMLPSDGAAVPFANDSHTSSGGRLAACIAALKPYPSLYVAVSPLLDRVSDLPDPPAEPPT